MRYTWLDEYLLEKAGVTKDLQKDWNWIRYSIGGKMFVAVCLGDDNEPQLKDLLDKSYQLVLGGFSRKKQSELLGLSSNP